MTAELQVLLGVHVQIYHSRRAQRAPTCSGQEDVWGQKMEWTERTETSRRGRPDGLWSVVDQLTLGCLPQEHGRSQAFLGCSSSRKDRWAVVSPGNLV